MLVFKRSRARGSNRDKKRKKQRRARCRGLVLGRGCSLSCCVGHRICR